MQSEQGAVHAVQLGYGSENSPTAQFVHLLPPTSRWKPTQEVQSVALVQFWQGELQLLQPVVPLKYCPGLQVTQVFIVVRFLEATHDRQLDDDDPLQVRQLVWQGLQEVPDQYCADVQRKHWLL